MFWDRSGEDVNKNKIKEAVDYAEVVLNNLNEAVIVYDKNFSISIFNPASQRIFGINREEVIGRQFGPEKVKNKNTRLLTQVLFPSLAPLVTRRSDSAVYPQVMNLSFENPEMELTVITDKLGEQGGFIKIIQDKTREAELYKSKSEFITIAAHQLRTPLSALNWTFDALSKSAPISPEDKELIENGSTLSARLVKIVNDLLDVAKIEDGKFGYTFQSVNLTSFLDEVLKSANIVAKQHDVNIYFEKNQGDFISQIDPNKLGLAVSNLIDNAIKYNVKGGSVTVAIRKMQDKPFIEVSIKDTGIGIPGDVIQKLFSKFFRAENATRLQTEGTGLGLYITKNIIARHGGIVWVESTLGRGSTFYFTIPTDPSLIPPREVFYEG